MSEALHLSPQHACMILSLPAMGQDHVLLVHPPGVVCALCSCGAGLCLLRMQCRIL